MADVFRARGQRDEKRLAAMQALGADLAEGSGLGIQSGLSPKRKPTGIEASTG